MILKSQWRTFAFWVSAILIMVFATIFYQPAAAKTGSLLVWTNNRVYVMDIDTLTLERVGPASAGETITPSPGCFGQVQESCRGVIGDKLYRVILSGGGTDVSVTNLPGGEGFRWANGAVSWSPDGVHLAYSMFNQQSKRAELRILDAATGEVKIKASDVDATVAVAWTEDCVEDLYIATCELGYKKMVAQDKPDTLPALVGFSPASQQVRQWSISPEKIFELRWSADEVLQYSRPKRHFINADERTPAYQMPQGAKLAGLSPDDRYTVYYQPFTLQGCQAADDDSCLHLGVWLEENGAEEKRSLIYNVELAHQTGGLNFIPIWSADDNSFVFFQDGKMVHYDLEKGEATIWYKLLTGKLRSVPVFSPNEEAVAFVDDQGQGYSEYRLLVINPRLQPVEHIIEANSGFRVLAWLPN